MKFHISIIKIFLLFAVFSMVSNDVNSQSCYQIEIDHVGAEAFSHDLLDDAACELIDSIGYTGSDPFKVLAFNLYPVLGAVDKTIGLDYNLNTIDGILASKGYYLAIIKKINFEEDIYSMSSNHSIEYIIKYNLPSANSNVNLTTLGKSALFEVLQQEANEDIKENGNTVITEIALMNKLLNSLDDIGTEENMKILGYEFVPTENANQVRSLTTSNPTNNEFSIIQMKNESGTWVSISSFLPTSGEADFYGKTIGINFITSSSIDTSSISLAHGQLINVTDDIVNIHVHHDSNKDGLYFLSKWTEKTASEIMSILLQSRLTDAGFDVSFGEQDYTKPGNSRNDDWALMRKLLDEHKNTDLFNNTFTSESAKFGVGVGCGILVGFLVTIDALWEFIKKSKEAAVEFIESDCDLCFWKLVEFHNNRGLLPTMYKVYKKLIRDPVSEGYDNVKEVSKLIVNSASSLTGQEIVNIMNNARESLLGWFGDFIADRVELGYDVGKFAFIVILEYFTLGVGTKQKAITYLDEVATFMTKGEWDNIADNLHNYLKAAEDTPQLKSSVNKCKILGKGCFVKDTPVLIAEKMNKFRMRNSTRAIALAATMPIVAVPIQDVQLLDYAVSHKTVNTQKNLIASSNEDLYFVSLPEDPYTSPQQNERDKFELNHTDWYGVSLEQIEGPTLCQFALHKDWIRNKGYETGKIVSLNLPEQGINGQFRITSIKHIIPQKKPEGDAGLGYDWQPVTGLFQHQSNQVYRIFFNNGEKLEVTYKHPIYSLSIEDWRLAGELEIGEKVLTYQGESIVTKLEKKVGTESVYNLEVKEYHNFLVGKSGILVHNACSKTLVKDYLDGTEDIAALDDGPVKSALLKLKQMKDSGDSNYLNFLNDFPEDVPLSLGEDVVK
ncbi:MAG: Hint domain-containing protein, partial [Bacteroidota bacterium]